MLIFDKWYVQKYGCEYEYTDDVTDTEFAEEYLAYRKSFPYEMSFYDAWVFLENHPVFKGVFNDYCLNIHPMREDDLSVCILLETSVFIENDYTDEKITAEFIPLGNVSLDVWADTFEDGIRELAMLIKYEYGDYTEDETILSKLELTFGKAQALIQLALLEENS